MQISLQAVPIDENTYVIECSECGPVGMEEVEDVNDFAYRHLQEAHDASEMEWKIGDGPWPEPPV